MDDVLPGSADIKTRTAPRAMAGQCESGISKSAFVLKTGSSKKKQAVQDVFSDISINEYEASLLHVSMAHGQLSGPISSIPCPMCLRYYIHPELPHVQNIPPSF